MKLASWLAAAMVSWLPARELTPERRVTIDRVAQEIVDIAYAPGESAFFGGPHGRARSALQIAAVGTMESGWRSDVQEGHCRPHECDHGLAKCWMQIHPETGLVLLPNGGYDYVARRSHWVEGDRSIVVAPDDLRDERTCLLAGAHMIRSSLWHTGGLREYTGEHVDDDPKAVHRMKLASAWLRVHPVPVDDADVLGR